MGWSRVLGQIGRGTIRSAKQTPRAWAFSQRRPMRQPVANTDPRGSEIKRNWHSVFRIEEGHSHAHDQSGSYWADLRFFSSSHKVGEGVMERQESGFKFWVRLQGTRQPIAVNSGNATNVSEFVKILKREFSPDTDEFGVSRLILVKTNGTEALPTDLVSSLSVAVSFETPLVLQPQSKAIFIQDIDEDLQPLDSFSMIKVYSDNDIRAIFENKGSALIKVSGPLEPRVRLTKFLEIEDQAKYKVFSRYENALLDEVRWQEMEDKAMEAEVALATKAFLLKNLGERVEELPRVIFDKHGRIVQEWDGIYKVRDTLYLGEAKHIMTVRKIQKFPERLRQFKDLVDAGRQPWFDGVQKVIGVACGTFFPQLVQETAHQLDLVCVFPSGNRCQVIRFQMLPKSSSS